MTVAVCVLVVAEVVALLAVLWFGWQTRRQAWANGVASGLRKIGPASFVTRERAEGLEIRAEAGIRVIVLGGEAMVHIADVIELIETVVPYEGHVSVTPSMRRAFLKAMGTVLAPDGSQPDDHKI